MDFLSVTISAPSRAFQNTSIMYNHNHSPLLPWQNNEESIRFGAYLRSDNTSLRDSMMAAHVQQVNKLLSHCKEGDALFEKTLRSRFLTIEEWQLLRSHQHKSVPPFALMYWKLLQSKNLLSTATDDDEQLYPDLLKRCLPRTKAFFFSPQPVPVPLSALDRHLIITGRTGSGKTEFLKALFYQLQFRSHKKKQSSLILLDPHGDLAEQLFALRLNLLAPERIWYIDPTLSPNKIPCLNPFWHAVKDAAMVDILAQQWAKTFSELIPEAGMSLQMEAVLKPCLAVLFQKGNCGLSDLQDFMDDSTNAHWVALGKQAQHPVYSSFFEHAFMNKKYAPTKLAVYTRLQLLLNNQTFYRMMNGQSSVDIKKGMQEGKVMLFNLSKGKLGEDTSRALGRFISATLLSFALQRAFEAESKRKPCYLFVDEFHNFASASMETVFSEARKYRLHLLVGTQTVGQLPASLKDMVLNNTAVKLVGLNGLPALKSQAGDIGVSFSALQQLPPYHFYLKIDHHAPLKIKSPDALLKNAKRYFASAKELKVLKEYLLEESGLYRNIERNKEQHQEHTQAHSSGANNTLPDNSLENINDPNTDSFKPRFEL